MKGPKDYIEVKDRLVLFIAQYPEGSIQGDYELANVNGETTYIYTARAFRHPDDQRPGIGHAAEVVPGKTAFTRGSELENASTSATGRALVSLGIAAHKGLASAGDVRKAQIENKGFKALPAGAATGVAAPAPAVPTIGDGDKRKVTGLATEKLIDDSHLAQLMCQATGNPDACPTFEGEHSATRWVGIALERFPASSVPALIKLIDVNGTSVVS